jgi:CRP/FNR family transcriptional regulator, anaerobic regulatory protein
MTPELIGLYIRQFHNVSDETLNYFAAQFEEVRYPAKHIFQKEGDVCTRVGILHKGLVRNYFNRNNRECIAWFDIEGDFVGSMYSFFTQSPYSESIEMLEDCIIYETTYEQVNKTRMMFKDFDVLVNNVIMWSYHQVEERTRNLMAYTAVERYDLFFKTYPELINRIPVKHLASFLGVTPETLSRIRANNY